MFTKIIIGLTALSSTFTVMDTPLNQLTTENISINYNMMKSSDSIGNESYINYGKQENGTLPYILDFYKDHIDNYDFDLAIFSNGSRILFYNNVTNISYDDSTLSYILTYGSSTAYINSANTLGGTCYNNIAVEIPISQRFDFTVRFDVYSSYDKLTYNLFCQPFYRLSRYQSSFNLFHIGVNYTESSRQLQFGNRFNPYAYAMEDYYLFRNDYQTVLYRSNVNIYNSSQYKMISNLFNFTSTSKYQILGHLNFEDYFREYALSVIDEYENTPIIENDIPSLYLYDFVLVDSYLNQPFNYFYGKFEDFEGTSTQDFEYTTRVNFKVYGYSEVTQRSTLFISFTFVRNPIFTDNKLEIIDLLTVKSRFYTIQSYFIKPNQVLNDTNLNYYSKFFNPDLFQLLEGDTVVPPVQDPTNSLGNVFNLFGLALTSFAGLFSIVIFPSVTVGTLLLIPLTLTLLFFVINLFKR